jgi:predicted metal-dependent peptidase
MAEGLDLHMTSCGRGLLPGDLVEEIRAIQQKPIPWDVRLGQWMDAFFPLLEARRSFARASRRQASTPDIPRPVWIVPEERLATRTFGVVLDTSGSMPARLLGRALGAIAAYALSREVPAVRVMQCDAGVHDMGYMKPEALLGSVEIRGRGGTVLQPAITRLEGDDRFPKDAPILVITDGCCDRLEIRREHAYLMPEGARLPFRTEAPQFHFEKPSG